MLLNEWLINNVLSNKIVNNRKTKSQQNRRHPRHFLCWAQQTLRVRSSFKRCKMVQKVQERSNCATLALPAGENRTYWWHLTHSKNNRRITGLSTAASTSAERDCPSVRTFAPGLPTSQGGSSSLRSVSASSRATAGLSQHNFTTIWRAVELEFVCFRSLCAGRSAWKVLGSNFWLILFDLKALEVIIFGCEGEVWDERWTIT